MLQWACEEVAKLYAGSMPVAFVMGRTGSMGSPAVGPFVAAAAVTW